MTIPPPTPNRAPKRPPTTPTATSCAVGRTFPTLDRVDALTLIASDPHAAALFLDVDGVLAPIVERPDEASVPAATRRELERLARAYGLVACVTGRPADVARRIVGVEGIRYVGEHGLELDPDAPAWAGRMQAFADRSGWADVERKPLSVAFHYRGAPDADLARLQLEDVARDALAVWRRDPIAVAAGERSYSVEIGQRFAAERLPALLSHASLGLLITDRNVQLHHGDGVENGMEQAGTRTATVILEPGEEHKNTASLERIWNAALAASADRKSRFVALGGGVVTDVAGFAAATWMRGVSWLGLPTTLLAMVDASVGGKTAIDLKTVKNAVGAFWQPSAVLCDVEFLGTEPARGFSSALAEIVKTAIIGDADLFTLVEKHADEIRARDAGIVAEMVRRSVRVKARIVGLDEREDGLRASLNLGHTVGHALEAHAGYGRLRHGEAVSLGLIAALRIGERLGFTDRSLVERCILALRVLGLPVELSSQPLAKAVDLIGHDKKRAGSQVRFVVARSVGSVELVDLGLDDLRGHVLALTG